MPISMLLSGLHASSRLMVVHKLWAYLGVKVRFSLLVSACFNSSVTPFMDFVRVIYNAHLVFVPGFVRSGNSHQLELDM